MSLTFVNYLAQACGIYITPQVVVEFINKPLPPNYAPIYANPPYRVGQEDLMQTLLINLQANRAAWDADRPMIVVKCRVCHTCYPERDLERADMQEGVCVGCRGGHDDE